MRPVKSHDDAQLYCTSGSLTRGVHVARPGVSDARRARAVQVVQERCTDGAGYLHRLHCTATSKISGASGASTPHVQGKACACMTRHYMYTSFSIQSRLTNRMYVTYRVNVTYRMRDQTSETPFIMIQRFEQIL